MDNKSRSEIKTELQNTLYKLNTHIGNWRTKENSSDLAFSFEVGYGQALSDIFDNIEIKTVENWIVRVENRLRRWMNNKLEG